MSTEINPSIKVSELFRGAITDSGLARFIFNGLLKGGTIMERVSEREREWIHKYRSADDEQTKTDLLVENARGYVVAGILDTDTGGVRQMNGLMLVKVFDSDNVGISDYCDFKREVRKIPYIFYCGRNLDDNGYNIIVRVDNPYRMWEHWEMIRRDFEDCGINIAFDNVSPELATAYASYDPNPYLNWKADSYCKLLPYEERRISEGTGKRFTKRETLNAFLSVLDEIERRGIDVTGDYKRWQRILCSIASEFGEDGLEYAHRVSKYYDGYSSNETEREYKKALRYNYERVRIATFLYYARIGLGEHDFDDIVSDEDRL